MARSIRTHKIVTTVVFAALVAAAAHLAGCGGGSDYVDACVKNPSICYGKTRVILKGSVVVPASLVLARESGAGRSAQLTSVQNFSGADVRIGHMKYSTSRNVYMDWDIVASARVGADGTYTLYNVPTDDNMILEASLTTTGGITYTTRNIITVSDLQAGGSVNADTTTVETTFAAAALEDILLDYNLNSTGSLYFDAEDISTSSVSYLVSLINSNLQTQVSSGTVSITDVLYSNMSLLSQLDNLADAVPSIRNQIDTMSTPSGGVTSPYVLSFTPASGATGVDCDGTIFSVKFSQSMDSSVNLNTQATLTASGFSLTLAKSGGSSLTINSTNALSYGSFGWTITSLANDTLTFTLKSNANLTAATLKTLKPSTIYNITGRTVPTNLKSATGAALNTTGISSSGSFTTATTCQ